MSINLIDDPSKTKRKNSVYSKINELASPGDILFVISENPNQKMSLIRKMSRSLMGLDKTDSTHWHVALYIGKNEKNFPMMVEAQSKGVIVREIPHTYFSNTYFSNLEYLKTRMEIASYIGINNYEREKIVNFALEQVGKPFDWNQIYGRWLTYIFGIPNIFDNPNKLICQELVTEAYHEAGIPFGHPNIVPLIFKLFGLKREYPLGHSNNEENTKYSYLKDHHLYESSNLEILAAFWEGTRDVYYWETSPKKFSWKSNPFNEYEQQI